MRYTYHRRRRSTRYRSTSCECRYSKPHVPAGPKGAALRMFGTVQCATCGRAIFDADGKPVRS